MPASPIGKLEISLCTMDRIALSIDEANLQSRVGRLFFGGREIYPLELAYSIATDLQKRQTLSFP
jgi:hypothetical protein